MSNLEVILTIVVGSGVLLFVIKRLFPSKKDSLDLIKEYNDEMNEIVIVLKESLRKKDELHEKEIQQYKKELKEERTQTAKYRKMVDDLLEAHKEKDSQIEDMRDMLDQNKKTIASWSESSLKKDLIIKDLKSKLSDE